MTIGSNDFEVIASISHKDSGYSFEQADEVMLVKLPGGTTIATVPIPEAWYFTTKNNRIDVVGLKVLAIDWLKENWENK